MWRRTWKSPQCKVSRVQSCPFLDLLPISSENHPSVISTVTFSDLAHWHVTRIGQYSTQSRFCIILWHQNFEDAVAHKGSQHVPGTIFQTPTFSSPCSWFLIQPQYPKNSIKSDVCARPAETNSCAFSKLMRYTPEVTSRDMLAKSSLTWRQKLRMPLTWASRIPSQSPPNQMFQEGPLMPSCRVLKPLGRLIMIPAAPTKWFHKMRRVEGEPEEQVSRLRTIIYSQWLFVGKVALPNWNSL